MTAGSGSPAVPLPEFPRFDELAWEHGPAVRELLDPVERLVSEFTFANLYLFRTAHGYRVSRLGRFLLVVGRGYRGGSYGFPPLGVGDQEPAARQLCAHLAAGGVPPVLFPVPRPWVEARFSGPAWSATEDRDQADYVYRRDDLAHLPGKAYHKRRNRLEKFLREVEGEWAYAALGPEHRDECLQLAGAWCDIRCSAERPSTYLETEAAREALQRREALGLRGGVILVQGRVRAFCLGEDLGAGTFVVHFEKADPSAEGLAPLMTREFCLHGLAGYRYVNREQDLGDPGLRRAKESFHPVRLEEKFRVGPAPASAPP